MFRFSRLAVVRVIGELLFLYGFLGWAYGVVQLTHPSWMAYSLSHLIVWIRIDTFTVLSFVVSAFGFLLWRLAREMASPADVRKTV